MKLLPAMGIIYFMIGGFFAEVLPQSPQNTIQENITVEHLDPAMFAPIEKVARFIETGNESLLSAFAKKGVVIIENFTPYLFEGDDAVKRWSQKIISWHKPPSDLVLKHKFGTIQDLRIGENLAFLSIATHWTISENGETIEEDGGWAFVLVREDGEWRVRSYGWAVTKIGN